MARAAIAVVLASALGSPALALEPGGDSTSPATTTLPAGDDPSADPSAPPLAPAGADEAGRQQAKAELAAAQRSLRDADRQKRTAARRLVPFERAVGALEVELQRLDAEEQALALQLEAARNELRSLAVENYMAGGHAAPLNSLLGSRDASQLARRQVIAGSAADAKQAAIENYLAAKEAATARVTDAVGRLGAARVQLASAHEALVAATTEMQRMQGEVAHRQLMLDLVSAAAPVLPTDIPRLVLDAYQRAAAATAKARPHCKVKWTALAAIGRIESNHARSKGGRLALNGEVWPTILGKPLDGTNNTRLIHDTDGGVYDGDTVVDRAVGPMQFIPSTWKRVRQDGNGDGATSPNNVYDAAFAAGAYLCRAVPAGGLDAEAALRPAFFSYNHSDAYVEAVLVWWRNYEALAPGLNASPR